MNFLSILSIVVEWNADQIQKFAKHYQKSAKFKCFLGPHSIQNHWTSNMASSACTPELLFSDRKTSLWTYSSTFHDDQMRSWTLKTLQGLSVLAIQEGNHNELVDSYRMLTQQIISSLKILVWKKSYCSVICAIDFINFQ